MTYFELKHAKSHFKYISLCIELTILPWQRNIQFQPYL